MKAVDFIKACGRSIYDRNFIVIPAQEWLEILNFQAGEIYPEIGYRGTITGNVADLNDEYQLDLNTYTTLEEVREVHLEDADGYKFPYDNWIYNKEIKMLDMEPASSKDPTLVIGNYTKYHIVWFGAIPEITQTQSEIALTSSKLIVLQKICIKEALNRILWDHTKLDRYRTLVSRMNEYALLAMIRDLTTEIELKKRRLVDTHPLRSF